MGVMQLILLRFWKVKFSDMYFKQMKSPAKKKLSSWVILLENLGVSYDKLGRLKCMVIAFVEST